MKILLAILLWGMIAHGNPSRLTMQEGVTKGKLDKGTYAINAINTFSAEHSLLADHAHHADCAKVAIFAEYAFKAKKAEYAKDADKAVDAKYAETAHYAVCAEGAKVVMKIMPMSLQHIPTNVGGRSYGEVKSTMLADAPSRNNHRRHQYKRDVSSLDDTERDDDKFKGTFRKVYHNAVKADEAVYAINAVTATDAGDAKTADKAVFADKADKAFNSDFADVATHAVKAKHAENAFNALSADYARFIVKTGERC